MGLGVGTISLVLQENKDALPKLLSLEPQFCYLQNEVNISSRKFLKEMTYINKPFGKKHRMSHECYLRLLI